jgi:GTP-binding protein HflX
MAKKQPESTQRPVEKAFLVGVELHGIPSILSLDDSLAELELLADTAGLEVVGVLTQRLEKPHPDTFIGSGKVDELRMLVEDTEANVIIFDNILSPRHQRELEHVFHDKLQVMDRTALILDIFGQHARTREGILQVELAYYEYRLPRLTRAWTHLARQAGGGGGRAGSVGGVGLRGPGETQLEVDRRQINRRIVVLKEEIEKIREHRARHRQMRKRSKTPVVALVGYTNAGKSTLLNKMAKSDVLVADQLFATLDPTTRRITLPDKKIILLTDTVGFIQKLPTQLVAAFRATLEEISEADLLLHVIDVTHPNAREQALAVIDTLKEINANRIPVINVLNKIDLLDGGQQANESLHGFHDAVAISAISGDGLNLLLERIDDVLYRTYVSVSIKLPYAQGQLISLFHENGQVDQIKYGEKGVELKGRLPIRLLARYQEYIK